MHVFAVIYCGNEPITIITRHVSTSPNYCDWSITMVKLHKNMNENKLLILKNILHGISALGLL